MGSGIFFELNVPDPFNVPGLAHSQTQRRRVGEADRRAGLSSDAIYCPSPRLVLG